MGAEEDAIGFLSKNPNGASVSDIAQATGHTRATVAKYLEMMKLQSLVDYRDVGKAKLWVILNAKKKVLIAEDEEHIRRLVRVILQPEGYEFVEAKDGNEALEKVSEEMPDLIILDLMMPKIDGIEVCNQLKQNALTRKIPIIMLTAKKELSDRKTGIKAGADDYLTKPFEPRELRVRVNTLISGGSERNAVTNLPNFEHFAKNLESMGKEASFHLLHFENFYTYKKAYGLSKTNEMLRLTSQIITHILEKSGTRFWLAHIKNDDFLIGIESRNSSKIIRMVREEFELATPFFYDKHYSIVEKNALIRLAAKQLTREDLKAAKDGRTKLQELGHAV